jgi:hypothetical protein
MQGVFCSIASNLHCSTGLFKKKKKQRAGWAASFWLQTSQKRTDPAKREYSLLEGLNT